MPFSCQTFHLSFGKAKNKLYLCSGLIASMGIGPDKLEILRQANKLTGHQAANLQSSLSAHQPQDKP